MDGARDDKVVNESSAMLLTRIQGVWTHRAVEYFSFNSTVQYLFFFSIVEAWLFSKGRTIRR